MTDTISANTQVILLLTAPLLARGGETSSDLLPLGLYKKLARQLRTLDVQPADLLTAKADSIITDCGDIVEGDRLRRLLGRGFLLSQVIDRWQSRAIWVISRADPAYPRRMKHWLREDAPPVLYGCGSLERLDDGGLAVVGSRHVDDDLIAYTEAVGALAARAGYPVVTGGARGIDQAAMRGAAESGGQVIGILADSLEKSAMLRDHRQPLMDGRLVLLSPYDPGARFNVGHAMQRNKLIYALADAALVVNSDLGKGGTWAGATEQLEKFHFVPVYVRQTGQRSDGLDALRVLGASAWPEPREADSLADIFQADPAGGAAGGDNAASQGASAQVPAPESEDLKAAEPRAAADPGSDLSAARLWDVVRSVFLALLTTPRGEAAIAEELELSKGQVRAWLHRLMAEGLVIKSKSSLYVVAPEGQLEFSKIDIAQKAAE